MILLAPAGDINPKCRQRGLQLIPSLTLRVSVGCLIPDGAEQNHRGPYHHPPLLDRQSDGRDRAGRRELRSGTRLLAENGEEQFPRRLLGGLLPLANAQIIWLYLVARRYRISLRWRAQNWRGRCVVVFGVLNALAIVLLTAACILAPLLVANIVEFLVAPLNPWLETLQRLNRFFPVFDLVIVPFILAVILSGPPLLIALFISWLWSRFELVVVARNAKAPTTIPSAAISAAASSESHSA